MFNKLTNYGVKALLYWAAALVGLLALSGCIASLSDPSVQKSSSGVGGWSSSQPSPQTQSSRALREQADELARQQNWARAAELYTLSANQGRQHRTVSAQTLHLTYNRAAELWATAGNMEEAYKNWRQAAAVNRQAADMAQKSETKPYTTAYHLIVGAEYLLKAQDPETAVKQLPVAGQGTRIRIYRTRMEPAQPPLYDR